MNEFITKDGKKLRLGFTTGSCAAAAAKAAVWMLLSGTKKEQIYLMTPKGIGLDLPVSNIEMSGNTVSCAVKKESGDDPDSTDGVLIFASVSFSETDEISVDGGKGVGRVTKRGLEQPVGAAAINSVPREMILENVREICRLFDYQGGLSVVISVPDGEKLAQKTFNPRLGIEGGISILGTTGIVEPMSEQALIETIRIELRQRRENGAEYVLLTPGNYGADFCRQTIGVSPETAVLTSNFIGDALVLCNELGFQGALLVGHIGKLVKIAGGMFNTHSKYGDCRMEIIASHAGMIGLDSDSLAEIMNCVTCNDAVRILKEKGICEQVLNSISKKISIMLHQKTGGALKTGAILFSKEYGFLCETKNARQLLNMITEG